MAGKPNERQEKAFCSAISKLCGEHGPIRLSAGMHSIEQVIGARKVQERTTFGHENYADVIVEQEGGKELRMQLKNVRSPSYGGGGSAGVETSLPGLGDLFLKKAHAYLVKQIKAQPGDNIPRLYMPLSPAQQLVLLRGTPQIGGPIDYILSGPMDLSHKAYKNHLVFYNSALMTIEEYSSLVQLFLVYRRYSSDQMFDPKLYGNRMVPKIYGEGKVGVKILTGGRLILEQEIPKEGYIIR